MFHRVVHLDLKGAPWKVSYLEKLIPLFKKWGATGVLLEWEDTFPYTGDISNIGSLGSHNREDLYTEKEVQFILQSIRSQGMEPIQLFQTIGHMEFVLKHAEFSHLRELPRSASVLCPSKSESLVLCKNMALQLLRAQPDAKYIHIGGDEAWHMNVCADCKHKSEIHQHKEASLYLDHVTAVASFIKDNNVDIKVLMWDDMMRNIHVDILKAYDVGRLVQPVVWNYNAQALQIDGSLWERYSALFPYVWAGSAFKGANGSCQTVCDVARYASNQAAWQREVDDYKHKVNFVGVILTGWSRYDHFATLCELLPVALPSVASCLKMWNKPEGFTNEMVVSPYLPAQEWPGQELAERILLISSLRERCQMFLNSDQIETWLNDWQVERLHVSALQAEHIAAAALQLQQEISKHTDMSAALMQYLGRGSADEWATSRLSSLAARLCALATKATGVLERIRL